MNNTMQRLVAEAIATFTLTFAGTSAVMMDVANDGVVGHVGIAITFGFALMMMVYAIGHISGGHVNPAVTIGLTAAGKHPVALAGPYIVAQAAGAILASLAARAIHGDIADLAPTVPSGSAMDAFWVEIIATFLLVFVVSGVATDKRSPAAVTGFAIGGTVLFCALWAGPISGGSFNPARSLGPAVVGNTWTDFWVYVTAPFIGGVLGALAYNFIQGEGEAQTAREGESLPDAA
jgi:MIP family channel proteins